MHPKWPVGHTLNCDCLTETSFSSFRPCLWYQAHASIEIWFETYQIHILAFQIASFLSFGKIQEGKVFFSWSVLILFCLWIWPKYALGDRLAEIIGIKTLQRFIWKNWTSLLNRRCYGKVQSLYKKLHRLLSNLAIFKFKGSVFREEYFLSAVFPKGPFIN